ncbi:16S rRNA (guanine(527)-N(7))-methyltransferase RsmG [Thermodesulfobacteriota bacterium]
MQKQNQWAATIYLLLWISTRTASSKMEIGSVEWKSRLMTGAGIMGLPLDQRQIALFAIHARELLRWNRKINLTSITDPLDIAVKHFLDSIAPAALIPPGSSLLDIGSGGGFPGIPLKILIPSLSVTLIDASRKKVNFLKHLIRILEIDNAEARHARADYLLDVKMQTFDDPIKTKDERFEIIISRALSGLRDFVRMALPLLAEKGVIIALKGKLTEAEIDSVSAKEPVLSISEKRYTLPYLESERTIITIKRNE